MGDESWIYLYYYDPETKQQLSQSKEPTVTKSKKGMTGLEFNKEHSPLFT
jgi:hypothetical protein